MFLKHYDGGKGELLKWDLHTDGSAVAIVRTPYGVKVWNADQCELLDKEVSATIDLNAILAHDASYGICSICQNFDIRLSHCTISGFCGIPNIPIANNQFKLRGL